MGIPDLFKLVAPVTKDTHISEFKNKVIAIDVMGWL